jgi:hypothetical protein
MVSGARSAGLNFRIKKPYEVKIYTIDDYNDIMLSTVRGKRHLHYKHNVELASLYHKYMTGDNQDELIISYKTRETDEQKKQRIHITNSRTRYVCNKVYTQFDQVSRNDDTIEQVLWDGKVDETKFSDLEKRFEGFSDRQDLSSYLYEAMQYYAFYDPNAFLVTEFETLDDEIFTYPLEVRSHEAVNFEYHRGELQWLVVEHKIDIQDEKYDVAKNPLKGPEKKKGSRFILYAPDIAIEMRQLGKFDPLPEGYDSVVVQTKDGGKTTFAYRVFETNSVECPAIQVGYIRDPATNRETFVSPLYPAEEILRDLINTKSEYDLSRALHGFIQKYAYAMNCDYKDDRDGVRVWCQGGTLNTGNECPRCKGAGLILHKTVQDVILVRVPDGKEEHIPLDDFVHYVEIPQHIIDMQKKDLLDLEKAVSFAIFNTQVFDREEVMSTATEIRANLTNLYNVLYKYDLNVSRVWQHFVNLTAIHLGLSDNIMISRLPSSDYHLETLTELFLMRKEAETASATPSAIHSIDRKIAKKQNMDDPASEAWAHMTWLHGPYRDKNENEVLFLLSSSAPDDRLARLYKSYEEVIDTIREENPRFILMPYAEQRRVIFEVLDRLAPFVAPVPVTFRDTIEV